MKIMDYGLKSGKVRDIYDLGDNLLMVSSDRVSCFDEVLKSPVPGKGEILNRISAFWFSRLDEENHFISCDAADFPPEFREDFFRNRSMLVKKATPVRIECVARMYVKDSAADSGWISLEEPVFTPAVKNDDDHDENIDFEKLKEIVGEDLARELRDKSLSIVSKGASFLKKRGIELLDTKFEFGILDGKIILIDEVFTPDSSRFLDGEGRHLDKEFLRKFLKDSGHNMQLPLPAGVVAELQKRYEEIEKRILG